jgi:hypothetical protein
VPGSLRGKNAETMRKTKAADLRSTGSDDLRREYDLDYGKARPNRFAGRVDPNRIVVALDADVSKVFTTPESVNAVLRALIEVMPKTPAKPRASR